MLTAFERDHAANAGHVTQYFQRLWDTCILFDCTAQVRLRVGVVL